MISICLVPENTDFLVLISFPTTISKQISAKEDKYKKDIVLLAINRTHPDYTSFKPEKRSTETIEPKHETSSSESLRTRSQLEVVEIYKSSTHVNPILTSVGADTGKYFSASEAIDIVFR